MPEMVDSYSDAMIFAGWVGEPMSSDDIVDSAYLVKRLRGRISERDFIIFCQVVEWNYLGAFAELARDHNLSSESIRRIYGKAISELRRCVVREMGGSWKMFVW